MLPDAETLYASLTARDGRFDGQVFVCVKTTGIFCRMTCPARTPLRRNVEFRTLVADCQAAGFRACKRCHPEADAAQAGPLQAGSPLAGSSSVNTS